MATVLEISVDDISPSAVAILAGQRIPEERLDDERTAGLAGKALETFRRLAEPVGLATEVTIAEFETIYRGEGMNAPETPLEDICPASRSLSLFAVTVGEPVCREISILFNRNDFAAASMLDAAASVGADLTADTVERRYENRLRTSGMIDASLGVLRFSPGYCGWHVSSQKKLFGKLGPEQIGITLSESCLMQPLKSVSGVIIAGPVEIFDVDDTYSFCVDCETHSCRDRYRNLLRTQRPT